jgi:tetratricopeptide (TPR) repeat protein
VLGRARILASTERGAGASKALSDAALQADALYNEQPDDVEALRLANDCWNELGVFLMRGQTPGHVDPAATAALERGLEIARKALERNPDDPSQQAALAESLNSFAGALRRADDVDRAQSLCEEARVILEVLVERYPDTLGNKLELATVANQMGLAYDQRDENARAVPLYRRSIQLLTELVGAAPEDAVLWSRLGQSKANLASPVGHQGDLDAAVDLVREAIAAQAKARALAPENEEILSTYIGHCAMLAVIQREKRDWEAADAAFRLAIEAAPDDAHVRWNAMRNCVSVVEALRADTVLAPEERARQVDDYVARAVAHMRRSIELGRPVKSDLHEFKDPKPLHGTPAFEQYATEWLQNRKL